MTLNRTEAWAYLISQDLCEKDKISLLSQVKDVQSAVKYLEIVRKYHFFVTKKGGVELAKYHDVIYLSLLRHRYDESGILTLKFEFEKDGSIRSSQASKKVRWVAQFVDDDVSGDFLFRALEAGEFQERYRE